MSSGPARVGRRTQEPPAHAAARRLQPERAASERRVLAELEDWRAAVLPDAAAPLGADDLVRLLRACVATLALDPAIASGVSVHTVHYYRRKDIIDPPAGRTAAARYDAHHLWQVAGARLAGHLGLVTLAEARDALRGTDERTAMSFLAARVVDARARTLVRTAPAPAPSAGAGAARGSVRPLPGVPAREQTGAPAALVRATVVSLPGGAWCVVPAGHAAHGSADAADRLGRALARVLASAGRSSTDTLR